MINRAWQNTDFSFSTLFLTFNLFTVINPDTFQLLSFSLIRNSNSLLHPWNILRHCNHLFVLRVSVFVPCWVWWLADRAGEALSLRARWQGQRGDQWRLHLAENLGAQTEAVGELAEAQGLQVTGQGCYHPQQQLREMLCLDFYVRLLKRCKGPKQNWVVELNIITVHLKGLEGNVIWSYYAC